MSDPCAFDGCRNAAQERAALCSAHLKQRQQGKSLTSLRKQDRTPRQVLIDAALALADVPAEKPRAEWLRAEYRLLMAAIRYARRRAL